MTWLVWRQYRAQGAIAAVLLAGFAAVMVSSGLELDSQWHSMLTSGSCTVTGGGPDSCSNVSMGSVLGHDLVVLSVMVPAILGIFWGAPLVAHELEAGTGNYAWTQSVTRTRWLAVKAGWLLLATAVWGGAVAALVTWWSGPRNAAYGNAFQPNFFDVQYIVPVGYAVFATALGIAAGTLLRRTVPAIAVVLGGFIGLRLLIDNLRPHFMTPVTAYFTGGNVIQLPGSWSLGSGMTGPNGRQLAQNFSDGPAFNGVPLSSLPKACQPLANAPSPADPNAALRCLAAHGYRAYVTYQPASRLWAFQGIETGIYVVLAAVLIAVTFAIVRRRDA